MQEPEDKGELDIHNQKLESRNYELGLNGESYNMAKCLLTFSEYYSLKPEDSKNKNLFLQNICIKYMNLIIALFNFPEYHTPKPERK